MNINKAWNYMPTILVRTKGKRAVRVILRPFNVRAIDREVTDSELIDRAAAYAYKRGWKTVVVAPDEYFGEDARIHNMDSWNRSIYGYSAGKFLAHVGSTDAGNELFAILNQGSKE